MPSLVMVSNPTVQYVLYELLVSKWLQRRRTPLGVMANNKLSDLEIFGLSALAKLGATISTYPLLVIKNKVQVREIASLCVSCGSRRHQTVATSVPSLPSGHNVTHFGVGKAFVHARSLPSSGVHEASAGDSYSRIACDGPKPTRI